MASLGELVLKLSADVAKFQSDMGRAQRVAEQAASRMNKVLGAIGVGYLSMEGVERAIDSFRKLIDLADSVGDLSEALNISTQEINRLRIAAQAAGVDFGAFESMFFKFATRVAEARKGDGNAVALMTALGVSAAELNKAPFEAITQKALRMIATWEGGDKKMAVLREGFGKGGLAMADFASKYAQFGDVADKVGNVINPKLTEQADRFKDSMAKLSAASEGAKLALLEGFLPAINRVTEAMARSREQGSGFFGMLSEGLFTFLTGDDQYKAEKRVNDLENLKGRLLADLEDLRKGGNAPPVFVERLEQQLAVVQERLKSAIGLAQLARGEFFGKSGEAGKGEAPALPDPELAKRRFETIMRDLENRIGDERDLLASREKFLALYYEQDYLSINDFYSKRRSAIEEAVRAEGRLYEEQISQVQAMLARSGKDSEKEDLRRRVAEIENKKDGLVTRANVTRNELFFNEARDADQLNKKVRELTASLYELEGRYEEAARIRAVLATQDLTKRLAAERNEVALQDVDRYRELLKAQGLMNGQTERAQMLQEQLANTETRINIDRQFGIESELGGLRRLGEARKGAVDRLQEIAREMERIAAESENPRLIQNAENFRVKLEELAASADVLARKFDEIGQSSFATFITDLTEQTKTFGEAFRDMARSIEREVTRLAAQDIAAKVFGSASKGGGFGGVLAGIFRGGNGSVPTSAEENAGLEPASGFLDSLLSGVGKFFGGFRAGGGRVDPFHIYGVGEQGMEWFRPDTAGEIVPAGAMGSSVTNVFNIAVPPGTSRETAGQMGARVAMQLSRLNARFG